MEVAGAGFDFSLRNVAFSLYQIDRQLQLSSLGSRRQKVKRGERREGGRIRKKEERGEKKAGSSTATAARRNEYRRSLDARCATGKDQQVLVYDRKIRDSVR